MSKKIKDPSKKKTKKKLPLHPAELVWYIICGLLMVWGLTYIVMGIVAENLPVTTDESAFALANKEFARLFGLDWLGWGLIILSIGAVGAAVVLLALAGKSDREYEKNTRRAQRLAQLEAEVLKEEEASEKPEPVIEQ